MIVLRPDRWLCRWLLLLLLVFAAPVFAQDSGSEGQSAKDGPAYSTMADLLENSESRQALIDRLRQLASQQESAGETQGSSDAESRDQESGAANTEGSPAAESTASGDSEGSAETPVSFPRRMAQATSHIAGDIGGQFTSIVAMVGGFFGSGDAAASSGPSFSMSDFVSAAIDLALVIIATVAAFLILRRIASPLFSKFSQWALQGEGRSRLLRVILSVLVAAIVDIIVVVLAYVAGNLVATFLVGESGNLDTRLSLFLNAFLLIELFKCALRVLFSSRHEGLRLVSIEAAQARYCNRFLATLAGFVGYGMLVVVPILNTTLSPAFGKAVGVLIMLIALVWSVIVILKNRAGVRDMIMTKAEAAQMSASRVALRLLARIWHVIALLYAVMVFAVTLLHPETALPFVLLATLKTIIYIGIGMLVSGILTQLIGRRINLSDELRQRLPMLESRLNSYIPTLLKIIRAIILIAVVMYTLDAWGVFDLAAWYVSDAGSHTIATVVQVLLILIVAAIVWVGLASLIENFLNPDTGGGAPTARAQTLMSLFRNALAITLIIMTVMIILSQIGINIGPLIAGAGVLGLAIGFGAQKLVQDVITGVFIQLENAMNTGDVVTAGGITGTAERVSIRSVAIRDLAGTYHIVPFSSVDTVSNFMREFGNHVGEYGIAYRENIDYAIEQLQAAFDDLQASEEHGHKLLAPMTVAGVVALADSSVNIRVVIKTTPGDQWGVGRAFNRLVKLYFDKAGIEIPFPHTTLYFGQDRTGSAAPANLRIMQEDFTIDGSPAGQPKAHQTDAPNAIEGESRSTTESRAQDETHRKPNHDDVDGDNGDER
ncbi:mechanosensitive ion channel protein MscS [Salinicola sp. MH3R3-1]|uniref:mechanosensitive ion channel domain-containing protein n=1 Tax=Salinicola sp. MH3R3-1 TaxID=1928762 RepID=UPI00094E5F76|nr:mechanosensitive ion channel domain-containing protein [Salinicola sp. MH3R3-1]OLO09534.1 mechanosensitive ion channel protein MscS [Salinicola sp. MH3R3-1]